MKADNPRQIRRFAPLLAAAVLLAGPVQAQAELRCSAIPNLMRGYLQNHVRFNQLTEEIERRTIETYVRRLDSSRTLLLASEEAAMRASLRGILSKLGKDDCSALTDLQKTLIRHHEAAAKFVRATVNDPAYAVDPSVELVLDPEKRGYPATAEERDKLQRSLIHFQISNYLAAGTPLEEAKRRLIQRYERRLKQLLDVPPSEINADFLDSFAVSLDPHSNYLSADVLEDFRISMTLSLEGIGVALAERDGYAVAERIIPGGAADRQKGLKPKDKIIAVTQEDGKSIDIIDMPLRDAVALIRGKKGTKVGLTVLRQSDKTERFSIEIVRDTIDLEEQAAKLRFEERDVDGQHLKLAVLELPSFYGDADPTKRQCTDDMGRLLAQVKQQKADGLLLDLSRNGGGLLQHAVEISGYFLREGQVVAIENGRGQKQMLRDPDRSTLYAGPLVVLTSRVSASAAEILAGALKDYQRGVIVGDDHTFGKGTVQTVSTLPPGEGALKITTGLFFRPGGQSTQHSGVAADVVMPSFLSGVGEEFGEKAQPYSLPPESIAPFLDNSANADSGPDRWRKITPGTVAVLSERSKRRVEKDKDFVELREKIAEAKANSGVVKLADILKQQQEQAKADAEGAARSAVRPSGGAAGVVGEGASAAGIAPETGPEGEDDEMKSPQVQEALWILADLVTLSR
jgi:carboxyl-terminal processing protease